MLQAKSQARPLQEIVYNLPNSLTGLRFVLNYLAAYLFATCPQTAAAVLMVSVILDYFDGMVARKYNQCTFFGEIFDWITDIFNYAVALFWWNQMEPQLLGLLGTLFCLEIMTMLADIIAKCYGYHPKLTTDHWSTYMLRFTMRVEQRGYTSVGVGYWNTIFHFVCILARVLAFTSSPLWNYVFLACVPWAVSYVWMHLGYTLNILNRWNEELQDQQIRLKFVEQ